MGLILAIDDNPDNLISVSALLNISIPDCRVITAESGKQGIEMARQEAPDCILLDIYMPVMDGFEVCAKLKSHKATCFIPVIMLTAVKTDTRNRVKALELGADAFLTKPIDESELAAQVKAMLRIKAAEDKIREEKRLLEEKVQQRVHDLLIANDQRMAEAFGREQAEEGLKQSEARFRKMIQKSPLPMVITGNKQDILSFNDKFTELFGYTTADISSAGQWWRTAYPDDAYRRIVRESWTDAMADAQKNQTEIEMQEWDMTTKDGAKRTCEFNMVPLGEFSLIIMNDITERKKARKERVRLEKQLMQAQKMEAIGVLAGGIAHDFNNILYPLIGFAELLKEDLPKSGHLGDSVDEILHAAFRAKDLVKQILAFGRRLEDEIKPVRIQTVVREVVKLSHSVIPSTITIKTDIDDTCGPVMADEGQMHQCIMNLVTNSFQAMEDTGGTITILLSSKTYDENTVPDPGLLPGDYVRLSVRDTGPGIPSTIMDKVFEPYFTTKVVGKGTGLGLSVVHGIIKNCKGIIRLDSLPGKGTCFVIHLPVSATGKQTCGQPPAQKLSGSLPGGNERVLLVDDEENVLKVEKKMLDRLGYRVVPQIDPEIALDLVKENPNGFDIVITDMTMPKMTGEALVKEIHQINPEMPLIICTGYSDNLGRELMKKTGARALLIKPMSMPELATEIRNALDTQRS